MGKSYQHLKITSTSSPVSLPLLRIMDKVTSFHTPCPRGHEVKILVAQSCLTLYDPVDCSPLGSSVLGIFQTRILEWAAISFSRGFSQSRDWTRLSCITLPSKLPGMPPRGHYEWLFAKCFLFPSHLSPSAWVCTTTCSSVCDRCVSPSCTLQS